MKTIWKYQLMTSALQEIRIPKGATILTLQMQNGIPCIWAELEPDAEKEKRTFIIFGTGQPLMKPDFHELSYIGTYQQGSSWHVYEII